MSFFTEKINPVSKKIILFEIDIPAKGGTLPHLLNYEAGIWFWTITPEYIIDITAGVMTLILNPVPDDGLDVGSVLVNGLSYVKVNSIAELRFQEESFYYDEATTKIYFHFLDYNKPVGYFGLDYILLGMTTGFCNVAYSTGGVYFDDVEYLPRITSVPSISKQKDPLFFGIISFSGGTVSLMNHDGYFDNFKDLNIYNQPVRLKLGFDGMDFDDYRTVFTGFVETYNWDWDSFTVKINDPRKKLTNIITKNKFLIADWADLASDDVNKPVPVCYGSVRGAELLCVNDGNDLAADYIFFLSDTEYYPIVSVENVYLDGIALVGGEWTNNLAGGYITIDKDIYVTRGGDNITIGENRGSVTADFTAGNTSNIIAIIKDVLENYANLAFTVINFNTAEFNLVMSTAPAGCLYLKEYSTVISAIEKCCIASDTAFIVQDDGRYTARTYSSTRAPNRTIDLDEWMDRPNVSIDESKFLSSVTVQYNKKQSTNNFKAYYNNDYEIEVLKKYKGKKTKSIETILTLEAGAIAKSESIMELSKLISETVKRKTKIQNIDLEIMDVIIGSPQSRLSGSERLAKYEVIGINKNLSNFDVDLTLRFMDYFTPEPDPVTYDGILWNHYLFNDKLYSEAGVYV